MQAMNRKDKVLNNKTRNNQGPKSTNKSVMNRTMGLNKKEGWKKLDVNDIQYIIDDAWRKHSAKKKYNLSRNGITEGRGNEEHDGDFTIDVQRLQEL
jgi:hypothetical protein